MATIPQPSARQVELVAKAARHFLDADDSQDERKIDDGMTALVMTMYHHSFIYSFDWMEEAKRDADFYRSQMALNDMSFADLRKVFTVHLRMDRFALGHLDELRRSGYLRRAVQRLLEVCPADGDGVRS